MTTALRRSDELGDEDGRRREAGARAAVLERVHEDGDDRRVLRDDGQGVPTDEPQDAG